MVGRSRIDPSSSSATGSPRRVDARDGQELACLGVALDVQPACRHAIARQEVAHVVSLLGEPVSDHAHAARFERGARLPGRQQILEDREQLLLGRIPGLEQVVVQRDLVDRLDRGLGVGIGGQQHALGVGRQLPGLHEIVRSRQSRHPLVCDQQRDLVAAGADLFEQLESVGTGTCAHHAVALAEAAPQVPRDGRQHRGFVVHGDDRGATLLGLTVLRIPGDCRRLDHAPDASRRRSVAMISRNDIVIRYEQIA